jgi:hypothetical protein
MNGYPIPRIDDVLNQLKGGNYFSNIYLNSGYHQIPIEQNDVWKITFKSKEDIFEWMVITFGSTNALYSFMRFMDDILWPFTNSFMVVYLDGILISARVGKNTCITFSMSSTIHGITSYILT